MEGVTVSLGASRSSTSRSNTFENFSQQQTFTDRLQYSSASQSHPGVDNQEALSRDSQQVCAQNEDESNSVIANDAVNLHNNNTVLVVQLPPGTSTAFLTSVTQPQLVKNPNLEQRSIKQRKCGWEKGRKRKKPHPRLQTPKPPASAFTLFSRKQRYRIQQCHQNLTFGEMSRAIGKKWNSLSAESKMDYYEEAEKEKERYKIEMLAFQKSEEYKAYISWKIEQETKNEKQNEKLLNDSDLNLYCSVCDTYYNNFHNKEEHLKSAGHYKNVIGPFEKFLTSKANKSNDDSQCQCKSTFQWQSINDFENLICQMNEDKGTELDHLRNKIKELQLKLEEKKERIDSINNQVICLAEDRASKVQEVAVLQQKHHKIEIFIDLFG